MQARMGHLLMPIHGHAQEGKNNQYSQCWTSVTRIRAVGLPRGLTTSKGVWGHAPPGNFGILSVMKCFLVHSESSSMQSLHEPLVARSITVLKPYQKNNAVWTQIVNVVRGHYFCNLYWVAMSSHNRYGHGRSGRSVSYGPDAVTQRYVY